MILKPATAAPGQSVLVSGTGARRTASRLYVEDKLAVSWTMGTKGTYARTVYAPSGANRVVKVILKQRRSDGVWAQVDSADLTVKSAPAPDPAPVISDVVVTPTATGASVRWHVSEFAKGWIKHGSTSAYGSETPHENSFTYQDHVQTIAGYGAGVPVSYSIVAEDMAGQRAESPGTFTTLSSQPGPEPPTPPPPPPPPANSIPAPASIKSDGSVNVTAALIDFVGANAGKRVALVPGGTYRCDSELAWTGVTGIGITSDPNNRATIKGQGYHPILHPRGCRDMYVGDVVLRGSAPNPGVTDKTHEYGHGVHLDGGQNYTFERLLIANVEGDGFYLAQDDKTPGRNLFVRDTRIEGISRMGIAPVAWDGVLAERMAYHNIAWSPIDLEPDPNEKYQQYAKNCIFDTGQITGWVGNWAVGGLQYRTPFYLGSPISHTTYIQPTIENVKILRHHVAASVRAGLAMRIDPVGDRGRTRNVEFAFNTADGPHNPLDGVGFVAAVNADGVNVHDNRMDLTSQGWALGNNGGSTDLSASGNTGANLIGQRKP